MDKRVTYLETGSQDLCYNLAFEEYVLTNRLEGDRLPPRRNNTSVIPN